MVKTLIELRDDIYKKLIELSIEKFGHPRGISKIINEILERYLPVKEKKNLNVKITIKLKEKIDLSPENLKKLREEAWKEVIDEELKWIK